MYIKEMKNLENAKVSVIINVPRWYIQIKDVVTDIPISLAVFAKVHSLK